MILGMQPGSWAGGAPARAGQVVHEQEAARFEDVGAQVVIFNQCSQGDRKGARLHDLALLVHEQKATKFQHVEGQTVIYFRVVGRGRACTSYGFEDVEGQTLIKKVAVSMMGRGRACTSLGRSCTSRKPRAASSSATRATRAASTPVPRFFSSARSVSSTWQGKTALLMSSQES